MSESPHVGVVIVNYNSWKETLACVDSLEDTEYENIEIYVVDNGSKDNSQKYLEDIENNHNVFYRETNDGYSVGANFGIEKAQGDNVEYILLLNNDTWVEPDFLSPLVRVLEENEKFVAASSIIKYANSNKIQYAGGRVAPHFARAYFHSEIKSDKPYRTGAVLGACILIRSRFLQSVGGLDESYFFGMDDIDLSYKILDQGYHMVVHPSSVIYHIGSATAGTWNAFRIYHSTRNRLHFIAANNSILEEPVALLYFLISRIAIISSFTDVEIGFQKLFKYTLLGILHHVTYRDFLRPEEF